MEGTAEGEVREEGAGLEGRREGKIIVFGGAGVGEREAGDVRVDKVGVSGRGGRREG